MISSNKNRPFIILKSVKQHILKSPNFTKPNIIINMSYCDYTKFKSNEIEDCLITAQGDYVCIESYDSKCDQAKKPYVDLELNEKGLAYDCKFELTE